MKRVPLKTILYQLSLDLDPALWNESTVLEWALKATRKMGGINLYKDNIEYFEIKDFKLQLPDTLKYLGQIFVYLPSINKNHINLQADIEEIEKKTLAPSPSYFVTHAPLDGIVTKKWKVVYESPGLIVPCMNIGTCFLQYKNHHDYLQFNIRNAIIMMNYKEYAQSEEGEYLIPDNENYKEALTHYIMYKIYDGKIKASPTKENMSERSWHLTRYNFLQAKAIGEINKPTEAQLENLRKNSLKMIGNLNLYEKGFMTFGTPTINS